MWAQRVELPAGKGKTVSAACIVAREYDAPPGVKPIEWRLLTNREAATVEALVELIDWYRARWEIEILFNVLNCNQTDALSSAKHPEQIAHHSHWQTTSPSAVFA